LAQRLFVQAAFEPRRLTDHRFEHGPGERAYAHEVRGLGGHLTPVGERTAEKVGRELQPDELPATVRHQLVQLDDPAEDVRVGVRLLAGSEQLGSGRDLATDGMTTEPRELGGLQRSADAFAPPLAGQAELRYRRTGNVLMQHDLTPI